MNTLKTQIKSIESSIDEITNSYQLDIEQHIEKRLFSLHNSKTIYHSISIPTEFYFTGGKFNFTFENVPLTIEIEKGQEDGKEYHFDSFVHNNILKELIVVTSMNSSLFQRNGFDLIKQFNKPKPSELEIISLQISENITKQFILTPQDSSCYVFEHEGLWCSYANEFGDLLIQFQ